MTADIVNLRQVRKQKARAEKERQAAENRAQFGQRKADRAQKQAEDNRSARALDGHRVKDDDGRS